MIRAIGCAAFGVDYFPAFALILGNPTVVPRRFVL